MQLEALADKIFTCGGDGLDGVALCGSIRAEGDDNGCNERQGCVRMTRIQLTQTQTKLTQPVTGNLDRLRMCGVTLIPVQ